MPTSQLKPPGSAERPLELPAPIDGEDFDPVGPKGTGISLFIKLGAVGAYIVTDGPPTMAVHDAPGSPVDTPAPIL